MSKFCPMCDAVTNCTDNCKSCLEEEQKMNTITIGSNHYGEKHYRVSLGTGLAWVQLFEVYAYNENEAVDIVADYCEENELKGLYADYYDIYDLCEDETVGEYANAHNLICCGNHGIYLDVAGLEEIA